MSYNLNRQECELSNSVLRFDSTLISRFQFSDRAAAVVERRGGPGSADRHFQRGDSAVRPHQQALERLWNPLRPGRRPPSTGRRTAGGRPSARVCGGGLLGFAVFSAVFTFVTRNWPGEIPGLHDFSLPATRPLLLLGAAVLACALVLGGLAVWFVRRLHVVERLNLGQDAAPFSSFRLRLNGAVVSVQLTAASVLLIGAALLTQSFIEAITVDLGYRPDGVLAAHLELPEDRYPGLETQAHAIQDLSERLRAIDGITRFGFASSLPSVGGGITSVNFPASELTPVVGWTFATPGFFAALGLRSIEGGLLPERAAGDPALVVNQSFSRVYLGDDPLGKTVLLGGKPYRVVGVVSDALQDGYLGRQKPAFYHHYLQQFGEGFLHDFDSPKLVLRVSGDPSNYISTVLGVIENQDPGIRVEWIRPLSEILAEQIAQPRFWTTLAVSLGLLALMFSTIALYALMSYHVSQRIPELAVRMTLGATSREVVRSVMGNALVIVGRGVFAGVILSLLVTALFADLLWGSAKPQAVTWIISLCPMIAAALLAAYIPTRRGAAIDPAQHLKSH